MHRSSISQRPFVRGFASTACLLSATLILAGCGGGSATVAGEDTAAMVPTAAAAPADAGRPAGLVAVPVAPAPAAATLNEDPAIGFDDGETLDVTTNAQLLQLTRPALNLPPHADPRDAFRVDPGRLVVQYEGGDDTERSARVVPSPTDAGQNVLAFALQAPNVRDAAGTPQKGRVQLNAYATDAVRAREVRLRVRMYLGEGFGSLSSLPKSFHWLTLSEWWNNAGWTGQPYPFRISVDLAKPTARAGTPLYFAVRAETLNTATRRWNKPIWSRVNTGVPAPVGQWVTLEVYFREGDASQGRFRMSMQADGGEPQVLFDQRGFTHHPDDPAPDGLTHLNPVKLYTSKLVVEHAAALGTPLEVFWDDIGFRLCRERGQGLESPCAPVQVSASKGP